MRQAAVALLRAEGLLDAKRMVQKDASVSERGGPNGPLLMLARWKGRMSRC